MKKLALISCRLLTIILGICLGVYSNNANNVLESKKVHNNIANTNAISMMYETEVDSGEYQVSGDSLWLQDGYTFNEALSKCENGSKLTWNEETKQVLLEANVSDK